MSTPQRYKVRAVRSGDYWAISAPDVKGVFSQTKRLDHVEAMAREALALALDAPEDSFVVDLHVELPPGLQTAVDEASAIKVEADAVQRTAARAAVGLVCHLVDYGLTYRDIGAILGVSHQRVEQLFKAGRRTTVEA